MGNNAARTGTRDWSFFFRLQGGPPNLWRAVGMAAMSPMDLARQSARFCKAPLSTTVEAIEKLTEKHVARLIGELKDSNGEMLAERDQHATTALERLTRKIGILSLLPATQRTDLCRRMNLLKIRDEDKPLFQQGDFCLDFYIPLVGAFHCVSELHVQKDIDYESGAFRPPVEVRRIVGAGKDMYFEQGVGMPWQQGTMHKEGATARCVSTAWPLLREPKEDKGKKQSGGDAKKMTISERRAAKRPGGLCIVLALAMQDVIDVLKVQETELQELGRTIGASLEPFQTWKGDDLCALAFQFERHVFTPGQPIVKEHASHNGRFYLLSKGKVDLVWTMQEHHKQLQLTMQCDQACPCFGEHLLCGEEFEAIGTGPDYTATASADGPCEMFVGNANDIAPYLSARDVKYLYELFELRRSRWFQAKSTSMSSKRRPPSRMNIPDSFYPSMGSPDEEGHLESVNRFQRFAPKGTKDKSPSKLRYTENLLSQDEESVDGTPRLGKVSPLPEYASRQMTKLLPSTRTLVRPKSIDLAEENWSMNLSSPYEGRMTFSAPPSVLLELSRTRMAQTSERLPTLLDARHIMKV